MKLKIEHREKKKIEKKKTQSTRSAFFISFLSGPVQFSAHLPKIQERRANISVSHAHLVMRSLFRLENIVHFISSCHSLLSPATSAPGNSLAPVSLCRLRQNAILRVVVHYRRMNPRPLRLGESIVRHSVRFLRFVCFVCVLLRWSSVIRFNFLPGKKIDK